jgi:hypothetical protein
VYKETLLFNKGRYEKRKKIIKTKPPPPTTRTPLAVNP